MTTDTAGPLHLAVVSAGLSVPSSTRLLADRLTEAVRTQLADAGNEVDNDALTGKPVPAAATGRTARHSLAVEHAQRPLFAYLCAVVVPTAVYAASEDWGGNGDPLTDTLPNRIKRAAAELAGLMRGRAGTAARTTSDDTAVVVVPFAQQLEALRPA
ncbi:NAD(P)H-dependent oxidoreductase [Streptomyces sp. NPDC006872]|uniref:NAD(P)H-dependent oxidoreductase n=1 Tax=Streptomyces sp. NPDC006872 TaxID=3155720 RepID=UPI0033FFA6B4